MKEREYYVEAPRAYERFGGLGFVLQHHQKNTVATAAHIHDLVELLFVKSGSYTVFLDGVEYAIKEGDMILFCSNSIHHVLTGSEEKNSYYVISVKPSLLWELYGGDRGADYVMRFMVSRPECRVLWRAEELKQSEILRVLGEMIREYDTGGYATEIAMKLRAAELLLCVLRDGENADWISESGGEMTGRIYEAVVYLRRHFKEDIDARGLADRVGVSYSYFSRCFSRITGKGFKEYLNMTRVNHAEQMLLTTSRSVTEVASDCGYNNVSYFISVYRRIKGVTPYRTARGRGEA